MRVEVASLSLWEKMLENGELYDRWGFYNAFVCFVPVGGFSCGCQWVYVLVYHNFYLFLYLQNWDYLKNIVHFVLSWTLLPFYDNVLAYAC